MSEKFYALTPEVCQRLLSANLTAAQWRFWCYLVNLDPFGDRYFDLPDTLKITEMLDMSQSTFYAAIAKFKKLELFDFQDKGFSFRNLTCRSLRKIGKNSEKSEKIPKNRNTDTPKNRKKFRKIGKNSEKSEKNSEKSENQSPEPLSSKGSGFSQTIQTIQTSSECILTRTRTGTHTHAHTRENPKPDLTNPELTAPNQDISQLSGENENLDEDKFSAAAPPPALLPEKTPLDTPNPKNYQLPSKITEAVLHPQKIVSEERNIRPQVRRPKFLYPDGEWLDSQGRMNVDFIRWMSSRWKVKFPDNAERPTEEIMADVLAYFANQPEKVAIQWDAYCAIASRKVENITQRALTGFTMSSVDAREYAIAASAIPSSQADAATDFTPQSVCDRSAEVQRVLSAPAHPAQVLQIAPGQRQKTLSAPAPIPDPWQVVGEPCRTEEQEGNWSEIVTAKRQEWENSRPPGAVNFSDAISGIPAEPTPFTREGFAIVDGQISAVSNQGAYKIMFDYQTPVQEIKTPPQDIADITPEQQAINCQKIAEMIKNLANKKSGKFAGKNWAEKLSTEATKPQYQVNKDGYFIDEEGEW